MQVLVLNLVILYDAVRLKDRVLFDLNHLMDECLNDPNSHVIVRCLCLVINRDQVQVDHEQNSLNLELGDDFLENLAKLEQALDYEAWKLDLSWIVFVAAQKIEEHAENGCLITILQASEHRSVQIFKNELTLFFIAQFV